MLTRIFQCTKGFQLFNRVPVRAGNSCITIGNNNQNGREGYYYIPLNDLSSEVDIVRAQFVLYGVRTTFLQNETMKLRIIPTSYYINPYENHPYVEENCSTLLFDYFIPEQQSVVILDVTALVRNWVSCTMPNNGLILGLYNRNRCIVFASPEDKLGAPFLEVCYQGTEEEVPGGEPMDAVKLHAVVERMEVS